MLRFSANISTLFTELPLLQRPEAAARQGFSAIEVQFPYAVTAEDFGRACMEAGTQVVLINLPAADLDKGELGLACWPGYQARFRADLDRTIAYARHINCPRINCLAGNLPTAANAEACWSTLLDNLYYAAEHAERQNIRLLCEVMNPLDLPRFLLTTAADGDRLLAGVKHPNLALQYDVYHRYRAAEAWLDGLITRLDQVGHIQISNCPGRHEPGSGNIDFASLFDVLRTSAYAGWVGCEYFPSTTSDASFGWIEELGIPGFRT